MGSDDTLAIKLSSDFAFPEEGVSYPKGIVFILVGRDCLSVEGGMGAQSWHYLGARGFSRKKLWSTTQSIWVQAGSLLTRTQEPSSAITKYSWT